MILALIYTIVTTHLLMINTCLYLHRGLAHRAVTWGPWATHFFRVITWFDGVHTKEWVAQHRRHHRYTDIPGDPHSPQLLGIWKIAGLGFFTSCYRRYGSKPWNTPEQLEIFGRGCPDDWLERKVYTKYLRSGILVLGAIDVLLFGWLGIAIWLVQVAWTPLWSNSVITGLSHHGKIRNFPGLGFFIIGDEHHAAHHQAPSQVRLAKWDLGYGYMHLAEKAGFCRMTKSCQT
jgi:stearoyl-CoA desaturase (Delta-9 desaturase)